MGILWAAALSGAIAAGLTRWVGTSVGVASPWLRPGASGPVAALGGAGAAGLASSWAELVAFGLLALACSFLVLIDLAEHRLPDRIVGPMYPALFLGLTVAAAIDGGWDDLGRAVVGSAVLLTCYFLLAWVNPAGMGLGDVKLSGLLGAFLGWLGWSHVLAGTLAAFVLNAVVALVVLVTTAATRRTDIPFGPAMVAGAAAGAAWGGLLVS